jgi:rubredoxin
MDVKCVGCGWISWDGPGALVEGTANGGVVIEAYDWQPGGRWKCSQCGHVVANPSPKQIALDGLVGAWLEAQRH